MWVNKVEKFQRIKEQVIKWLWGFVDYLKSLLLTGKLLLPTFFRWIDHWTALEFLPFKYVATLNTAGPLLRHRLYCASVKFNRQGRLDTERHLFVDAFRCGVWLIHKNYLLHFYLNILEMIEGKPFSLKGK